MKANCPYCGGEFEVAVELKPVGDEVEQYILENIMRLSWGFQPSKGYVKPVKGDPHTFEFYLQIYDSPEGDTWVSGRARWVPGHEFKILERKYS